MVIRPAPSKFVKCAALLERTVDLRREVDHATQLAVSTKSHGGDEAESGKPVVRGRLAPTPSGPIHLGNARTALLAWLAVRSQGGHLVMRIEDVDHGRCRPAYEVALLADLRWLGLDWDEGPDVGGAFGPYRQSQRSDFFAQALARLDTYPCTCTRRELRESEGAADGQEPLYAGTCRAGPTQPGRPAALRWHTPPATVVAHDLIYGPLVQDVAREAGDFILQRSDGAYAYQLAVVVDDAAMDITQVLRGADLLSSTPRQIHLQQTLGVPTPVYAHAPLLVGADGQKLSKRHRAPSIGQLRDAGADPRRVVAWLAHSLGLLDPRIDAVLPREMLPGFTLTKVCPGQSCVDPGAVAVMAAQR